MLSQFGCKVKHYFSHRQSFMFLNTYLDVSDIDSISRINHKKKRTKQEKELFFSLLSQKSCTFARMKETAIHISLLTKQEDELSTQELRLLNEARLATYRCYAPYSHFSVGAAVELADGTIVSGSNQENAAYPSGLCAERTAVFYANSRYPDVPIRRICIVARGTDGKPLHRPIAPCGACRQVLLEAEQRAGHPIEVMLHGTEGTYFIQSIRDLLPLSFDESFL